MPLIKNSSYQTSLLKKSGHYQSIYPSLFRKVEFQEPARERISTPDSDFLDLDWYKQDSKKLVIVTHGLEGNSTRAYIRGMAKRFFTSGFDICAWNFRSCSGEINRALRIYHSGDTDDIQTVIQNAISKNQYESIVLIGFSMGGNVTLKYLGQFADSVPDVVRGAVTFSVPVDLFASAIRLEDLENKIYMIRFLKMLGEKVKVKSEMYPDKISYDGYSKIKNFKQFDDRYTSKIHGFKDAEDYWIQSSSLQFLSKIKIPALLVNAQNDPFLTEECFPKEIAEKSHNFYFEFPDSGGHCGFVTDSEFYWSEERALEFVTEIILKKK